MEGNDVNEPEISCFGFLKKNEDNYWWAVEEVIERRQRPSSTDRIITSSISWPKCLATKNKFPHVIWRPIGSSCRRLPIGHFTFYFFIELGSIFMNFEMNFSRSTTREIESFEPRKFLNFEIWEIWLKRTISSIMKCAVSLSNRNKLFPSPNWTFPWKKK